MEQQKPHIDYSEVFDEDVGQDEGMWVWEIENFYPSIIDPSLHGHFYDADCYLILHTTRVCFSKVMNTKKKKISAIRIEDVTGPSEVVSMSFPYRHELKCLAGK